MDTVPLTLVTIDELTRNITTQYANFTLASVNDHMVKVSVMTQDYYWHYHPNSDETFLGIEGILLIDMETETIELQPGQLFTIPKNVIHRTRPKTQRSVNVTVEHGQIETVRIER